MSAATQHIQAELQHLDGKEGRQDIAFPELLESIGPTLAWNVWREIGHTRRKRKPVPLVQVCAALLKQGCPSPVPEVVREHSAVPTWCRAVEGLDPREALQLTGRNNIFLRSDPPAVLTVSEMTLTRFVDGMVTHTLPLVQQRIIMHDAEAIHDGVKMYVGSIGSLLAPDGFIQAGSSKQQGFFIPLL